MRNEVRAASWIDLIEWLYADSWRPAIGRYRSTYAFRGMPDESAMLETSLARLAGADWELEAGLMRNFTKYARLEGAGGHTFWDWLALAQCHGLPTRLLDWTYSPFVAAHFATADLDQYDVDGVVWMVDFVRTHRLLPPLLRERLHADLSDVFTIQSLSQVAPSLADLERSSPEDLLLFFEPSSLDVRGENQFSLHSVMSRLDGSVQRVLESHQELYRRVIIPRGLKWEVRDKLDQANINERLLFPGLDGLARWLTRYYSRL